MMPGVLFVFPAESELKLQFNYCEEPEVVPELMHEFQNEPESWSYLPWIGKHEWGSEWLLESFGSADWFKVQEVGFLVSCMAGLKDTDCVVKYGSYMYLLC